VDCGDISNTPFDKLEAIHQLQKGWEAIGARKAKNTTQGKVPRLLELVEITQSVS
jgi:agmatinase